MIVRRGTPYFANQAPLLPMRIPTVEGPLRLGGSRRNGMGLLLSVDPPASARRPRVSVGILQGMRGRGLRGLGEAYAGSIAIQNLTTGDASAFKVGDRWRVAITGATPNAPVYANLNFRNMRMPMSGQQDLALSAWLGRYTDGLAAVGMTDSNGDWSTSGTFTPEQAGHWVQRWTVQGVPPSPGGLDFNVADSSGIVPGTLDVVPGGTPYYMLASNHPPTQLAPTDTVLTLQQQLDALKERLLPSGRVVPVASAPAAAAPPAVSSSGAKSAAGIVQTISDAASGFDVSTIPMWGWFAAAGVGALLIFGGHKK